MKKLTPNQLCRMTLGTHAVVSGVGIEDREEYAGKDVEEARRIFEVSALDGRTLFRMTEDNLEVWTRDHWYPSCPRHKDGRIADAVLDLCQCPPIDREPLLANRLVDLANAIREAA